LAKLLDRWHLDMNPRALCAGSRKQWVTVRRSTPACGECGVSARELAVPHGMYPVSLVPAGGVGWSGLVSDHVSRR
jgi:hypothetical protein